MFVVVVGAEVEVVEEIYFVNELVEDVFVAMIGAVDAIAVIVIALGIDVIVDVVAISSDNRLEWGFGE